MTTEGISDSDERLHPVEDPSPHWSDSLYFNAWDPGSDTFLMTRIAVQPNEERINAGMIVWRSGQPVYAYGRDVAGPPQSDWDVMTVEDLTYRMIEAGRSWAVQLADGETRAHLEWGGTGPVVSYQGHPDGPLPREVAWGHYEQSCRVTGDLILAGERVAFDGFGQRDHSWGFRHWAGLHSWHWITGFAGDGRAFNVFDVLDHRSNRTVNGYVQGADGPSYVVQAEREQERAADGSTTTYRLALTTADGTILTVTGEAAGSSVPVRPAGDQLVVVHETPVRIDLDGTPGYGIYEHLVTEFD